MRATSKRKMESASSVQQKDKMADGTPGEFRSSGEQIWKLIWNKHKIITWSYWPYISMPNASSPQASHNVTINRGSCFLTSNLTLKST